MNTRQKFTVRIHLAVWSLLVLVTVSITAIYFPLRIVSIFTLYNCALLAVLFYTIVYIVDRFLERRRFFVAFFLGALAFFFISGTRLFLNLAFLGRFEKFESSAIVLTPTVRIGLLVLFTSAFVTLFAVGMQLLLNRVRRQRATLALLQEQQAAQIDYLKAQINPHFLFNALNNIYSLTVTKSPEAPKMLLVLSGLLRYAIYEGRERETHLEKEIEHIRKFIELFQMKSEKPPDIVFEVRGSPEGKKIEPMILIPIVENCFKHCDFEVNPKAKVNILLTVSNDELLFSTENTFDGADRQRDAAGGVGLDNIRRRLMLRYPDAHLFSVEENKNRFRVELSIRLNP